MPFSVASVTPDLEQPLMRVEAQLAALSNALKASDVAALERAANELHRALAAAVDHFRLAARQGAVPAPLRLRLAAASAEVAAQRESLARATAALDRAIDVLIPGNAPTYGVAGLGGRQASTGSLLA
jgi:type II secretory pathway pseudopilin PulG